MEPVDESHVTIFCSSEEKGEFAADIRVRYSTRFAGPWPAFCSLGRRAVTANGSCLAGGASRGIALPKEAEEAYLPVHMQDGKGQITLTGAYGDGVLLWVDEAECVSALPVLDNRG